MQGRRTLRGSFRPLVPALAVCWLLAMPASAWPRTPESNLRFQVSFPSSVHADPITGRVFVMISKTGGREPRLEAGFWGDTAPLFGVDVEQLKPGDTALIDGSTLGYPPRRLADIPAGDYYVQALINVYTECHRNDGHTIWVHLDQWEGQQFNRSPGNLYSEVQQVHVDPGAGYDVKLSLTKVIPPVEIPKDTEWVKHVKFQSWILTEFWGRPMYLGATVLLPKGYDSHPQAHYPVLYEQDHFSLGPAMGFSTDERPVTEGMKKRLSDYNRETGYQFYQAWNSDHFPRLIIVKFQHPTPYFDDSYAVNSVNNGPYGDAIMKELIPYVETHYRIIRQPYARVLSGGSTGGWESIALQVLHPDFFGGTWTLYPDPISFEHYQLINIYKDDNAFFEPGHTWLQAVRPVERSSEGQVEVTMEQMSQLEAVLGSHGRSAQQLEIWEAAYGPIGDDGYPKPLWDKLTGKIDHSVADYMRDHGYDLTAYLRANWRKVGPQLVGKIHIDVGDMDNYYLNLAVYDLQGFLRTTQDPHYEGEFEYGRPEKGHGWESMTQENLIRAMAEHIASNAPGGEDTSRWKY
ncbi:MAG TPA: alpha/beta hydrolase-fold protein [Terriglobia bacterium]|nr:alpha/beta hydrolase-fold protein [Terriglobia bacterium]